MRRHRRSLQALAQSSRRGARSANGYVLVVSDTILRFHAADPDFRADPVTTARARRVAEAMYPGADEIDIEVYERVTLIDCGENLGAHNLPALRCIDLVRVVE